MTRTAPATCLLCLTLTSCGLPDGGANNEPGPTGATAAPDSVSAARDMLPARSPRELLDAFRVAFAAGDTAAMEAMTAFPEDASAEERRVRLGAVGGGVAGTNRIDSLELTGLESFSGTPEQLAALGYVDAARLETTNPESGNSSNFDFVITEEDGKFLILRR